MPSKRARIIAFGGLQIVYELASGTEASILLNISSRHVADLQLGKKLEPGPFLSKAEGVNLNTLVPAFAAEEHWAECGIENDASQ